MKSFSEMQMAKVPNTVVSDYKKNEIVVLHERIGKTTQKQTVCT